MAHFDVETTACSEDEIEVKLGNRYEKFPKKYKDYYEIREYDGLERVVINYTRYEFDNLKNEVYMMKKILKDVTINADEKFEKISRLITNAMI